MATDLNVAREGAVPIIKIDRRGMILHANEAWDRFATGFRTAGVKSATKGRPMDYFAFLTTGGIAKTAGKTDAMTAEAGLRAFLSEEKGSFIFAVPEDAPKWIIQADLLPNQEGAILSHYPAPPATPPTAGSRKPGPDRTLFNNILDETIDGVFLCSLSGKLLFTNSTMNRWLGLKPGREMKGEKISEVFPHDVARIFLHENTETRTEGGSRVFEVKAGTEQGVRTFSVTKGLHRTASGRVKGIYGIVRDISNLRAMEREIIDTSDKEKQRIGQELHENLCQYLVGISLLGNVLHDELLRLELKQAEDARQITMLVKEAISEVRTLVKGLSTLPLEEDEGLLAALQELADQAQVIGRVRCTLNLPASVHFIKQTAAIHLFRIAQEAVHNAIKHAQATSIRLSLTYNQRIVVLTIKDNGIGYTPGYVPAETDSSGLGMHIMNYRSRAIGAKLEITSEPGKGTVVACTMPRV